jgi:hypothetical protein
MNKGWSVYAKVACKACGHVWTAVAPDETTPDQLECPECHKVGVYIADEPDDLRIAINLCWEHVRIGKGMELTNGLAEALEMVLDECEHLLDYQRIREYQADNARLTSEIERLREANAELQTASDNFFKTGPRCRECDKYAPPVVSRDCGVCVECNRAVWRDECDVNKTTPRWCPRSANQHRVIVARDSNDAQKEG